MLNWCDRIYPYIWSLISFGKSRNVSRQELALVCSTLFGLTCAILAGLLLLDFTQVPRICPMSDDYVENDLIRTEHEP